MLNADFSQTVTINGVDINVSDMAINEGVNEPITQIDFRVYESANTQQALDQLTPTALIQITQSAQGRSITWNAVIEERDVNRTNAEDVYTLRCAGESEILSRRSFTHLFESTTASGVILEAMDLFGGYSGISDSGVDTNDEDVGVITARQESILDIIDRVSKRSGWTWRVQNSVLYFYDPTTQPAPFAIESRKNIAEGSMSIQENISEVRNVIKAEAYEYTPVVVKRSVKGCAQAIYGPKFDPDEYEYNGGAEITSPDEISDVGVSVDIFSGRIEFNTPIFLESEIDDTLPEEEQDPSSQEFEVIVKYQVRRKLIAEGRDEGSIATYGERHGAFYPGNGGDDLQTVFKKIRTELRRKAFALSTATVGVTDFGIRAGDWVTFNPDGVIEATSMRVEAVKHTTQGADIQIDLELASRAYLGVDAVPELAQRVGNLEKEDIDPRAITGRVIQTIGNIQDVEAETESLEITGNFSATPVFDAQLDGGGQMVISAGQIETYDTARITEDGMTRVAEDGTIRVIELVETDSRVTADGFVRITEDDLKRQQE